MSTDWQPRQCVVPEQIVPQHVPDLIAKVLANRGLAADWESYLAPKLKNLRDPSSIVDLDQAVRRLLEALQKNECVCIYADFDLDGTSGLALLKCGLRELGFSQLIHYQPRRLTEGYGVHAEAVSQIAAQGCRVIVTVDVGITAFAAAERARELGMDLIITDHHLPQEKLPNAFAVVNPNRRECKSGLGHLSGAGVAFYLLMAVKRALQTANLLKRDVDLKSFLDFFVIGTLTDLVPLIAENRVLVRHGLLQLSQTKRPGLRALLEALEMANRSLGSQEVSIRFAPKLNALSRMDKDLLPIDLFLVENEESARILVERALGTNQTRLQLQQQAELEATKLASEMNQRGFVWVWSTQFHRGVVGLVATKLAQAFHVPAFVGACDADGIITGSARIPESSPYQLPEILAVARESLRRFGGHAAAAGFELHRDQAENFGTLLQAHFDRIQSHQFPPLIYDAEGSLADIHDEFLKWFDWLEPFGASFKPPIFRFNQVQANQVKTLRGGHLRLRLDDGIGMPREALWFSPQVQSEFVKEIEQGRRFDVLVEGGWNHFRGRKSFQFLIRDLR